MQSLHPIAHFATDGSVTLKAPGLAPAGEHKVLLVLEDTPSQAGVAMASSAASFARVWDNREDEIYDAL